MPDSEVVSLSTTANADTWISYAHDGSVVCSFEPGLEKYREGSDPHSFDADLTRFGLLLSDGRSPRQHGIDISGTMSSMWQIMESRFGLTLPYDLAIDGRLLAVLIPT